MSNGAADLAAKLTLFNICCLLADEFSIGELPRLIVDTISL